MVAHRGSCQDPVMEGKACRVKDHGGSPWLMPGSGEEGEGMLLKCLGGETDKICES